MINTTKAPQGLPWEVAPGNEGVTNYTRNEMQVRARRLLSSEKYLLALEKALIDRSIPPAVEVMLHHYAYGKPAETVNLNVAEQDLSRMSTDELLQHNERIMQTLREIRDVEDALSTQYTVQ